MTSTLVVTGRGIVARAMTGMGAGLRLGVRGPTQRGQRQDGGERDTADEQSTGAADPSRGEQPESGPCHADHTRRDPDDPDEQQQVAGIRQGKQALLVRQVGLLRASRRPS
jgi:hypothetical protein